MATMYRRMFLVVLLYGATFDVQARRIGEYTAKRLVGERTYRDAVAAFEAAPSRCTLRRRAEAETELDAVAGETARLKLEMTAFANALWFETVSPQIQGDELFRQMTRHVPVKSYRDELMSEIERTDALERQDKDRRAAEWRDALSMVAIFAGTMTLWFAFLGINVIPSFNWSCLTLLWIALVFLAGVVLGLAAAALYVAVDNDRGFGYGLRVVGAYAGMLLRPGRRNTTGC